MVAVQVWHNYSFDMHILQRRGLGIDEALLRERGHDPDALSLKLAGFAADTMHMARLHDAGRKGAKTYSLASLTSDKAVMCSPDRSVLARSKVSMKELFSVPKVTKSGKLSASLKELPAIHAIQVHPQSPPLCAPVVSARPLPACVQLALCLQTSEDPVTRWKWVDYSAFDSKATWDLYHSLREKLQSTWCTIDEKLRPGMCGGHSSYTQWDLYLDVWKPFGGALTNMEEVCDMLLRRSAVTVTCAGAVGMCRCCGHV
jgi:DNA polymerase I